MTASVPFSSPSEFPVPFMDLVAQYHGMSDEILSTVARVLGQQKFILGDEVLELEKSIASYCGARFAIGCNSGTDALILALQALGIGAGDEVITTPFSFFASASAIVRAGAKPVFADIDPATFNLDPTAVARAVSPRTKAIIPVHLFGQTCEMTAISQIAEQRQIPIVEDACQAIGAEYQGRRTGALGHVGCLSFFPTKNLGGAGDGGMMTTDDADLAQRLRRLRVHGDIGQYEHQEVGMNSRLDALQAAILRVKLKSLEDWTTARQANAERYQTLFTQRRLINQLTAPVTAPSRRHVFNQYCVRIPAVQRDAVIQELRSRQVGCMVYYPKPLHLQTCFANLGYKPGDFPEAERATQEILALPIYPELPWEHQLRVVDCLEQALKATAQLAVSRKVA